MQLKRSWRNQIIMTPPHNDQFLEHSILLSPPIKAIIFDWGGVFTVPRHDTSSTRNLEKSLALQEDTLSSRLYNNEYWTKAQIGKISDQEFWRLTLRQFDIFDDEGVAKFKEQLFSGERDRLRPGMIKSCKAAKTTLCRGIVN